MLSPADLFTLLKNLDIDLLSRTKPGIHVDLLIVGGGAFMLRGLTQRTATRDLDVLQAEDAAKEAMLHYPDMNMASAVWMCSLPYNFEDRIEQVPLNLRILRVFTPSLEDLIVMKLYAGRAKDMEDISSPAVLSVIEWEMLDYLVNNPSEAPASALNERNWKDMKANYEDYLRRCKPCAS